MSFIRNIKNPKILSFLLFLLLSFSVAYPLISVSESNPRSVLNPLGTAEIYIYGNNQEMKSFTYGDTLSYTLDVPKGFKVQSYKVTVSYITLKTINEYGLAEEIYRSCEQENLLINGKRPIYLTNGGAELIVYNPTGTQKLVFVLDNGDRCSFDILVTEETYKVYDYDNGVRVRISDEDKTSGRLDYTIVNDGGSVSLKTEAIVIDFPFYAKEVGIILKNVESGIEEGLAPVTDYIVSYSSTHTLISISNEAYKNVIGSYYFYDNAKVNLLLGFKTESDDIYYGYTSEIKELEKGITVNEFLYVTQPTFGDSESEMIVQGKLNIPSVYRGYVFGYDRIRSDYLRNTIKAEIIRYEAGTGNYLETFESTWISEGIAFEDVKFSSKYEDYLRLYLSIPLLEVSKGEIQIGGEGVRSTGIAINVYLQERPFSIENPRCEIDLGEISVLPQRYNYYIYREVSEDLYVQVEGRLTDYKLSWDAYEGIMPSVGAYHWVIVAEEKTVTEKLSLIWSRITRTEIGIGSVIIEYELPKYEIPEYESPKFPEVTFPQLNIEYSPPKLETISSFFSLVLPIGSFMSIILAIVISLYTINQFQKQSKEKQQYKVAR